MANRRFFRKIKKARPPDRIRGKRYRPTLQNDLGREVASGEPTYTKARAVIESTALFYNSVVSTSGAADGGGFTPGGSGGGGGPRNPAEMLP